MARFGFVGPSYKSQSVIADAQECINWYPEIMEMPNSKSPIALYPTPGLKTFCDLGQPSVRGLFALWDQLSPPSQPRVFAVAGNTMYRILEDGTFTAGAAIFTDDGRPISVAYDAQTPQALVISGGVAYASGAGPIGPGNWGPVVGMLGTPSRCAFCDGYFIVLLKDTMKFQISALFDATSWNALDVAIVSVQQDNLQSMIVDHRELWLFGARTTQVYYNSGNPDFPFDPVPGAFIEQGISDPDSVVRLDNSLFWLGADERGGKVAWRAQGYTPTRVSNHAVEQAWQGYPAASDAFSYAYQDQGHGFWVLSFPTANVTWVYDVATAQWHRRGFWDSPNARYIRHLGQNHVYAFGKHLVGDWRSGKVYEMAVNLYDDAGSPIRRMRRSPHLSNEMKRTFHSRLQLDAEVGMGLTYPAQGWDPQVMLRWSDDGSKTWSNEHWAAAGRSGEYRRRIIWNRLGNGRDRVYEVVVTDPIPWRIIDAYLDVEGGAS